MSEQDDIAPGGIDAGNQLRAAPADKTTAPAAAASLVVLYSLPPSTRIASFGTVSRASAFGKAQMRVSSLRVGMLTEIKVGALYYCA
ncbi:MAG: hypothetical protein VYD85_05040, partial [Pseudomonadota bacterium]|nr:hypothetical protein [Pseudomonadota bacterium]